MLKPGSGRLPTLVREMARSTISIQPTLCHLHRMTMFAYSGYVSDFQCRGRFVEYLLQRPDVKGAWRDHTHHDFVAAIAAGSLPLEAFKCYLVQDYLYLVCRFSCRGRISADLPRFNSQERTLWQGTKPNRWRTSRP